MATESADTGTTSSEKPRRKWQRRPAARRFDLTPEQRAELEEKEKAKRRTKRLNVKLTPDERAEIEKRAEASGNRLSDFARIVLLSDLKSPAPPACTPEALRGFVHQLSKLGGNLNQMAKVANEVFALPELAEFRELADEIRAVMGRVLPP